MILCILTAWNARLILLKGQVICRPAAPHLQDIWISLVRWTACNNLLSCFDKWWWIRLWSVVVGCIRRRIGVKRWVEGILKEATLQDRIRRRLFRPRCYFLQSVSKETMRMSGSSRGQRAGRLTGSDISSKASPIWSHWCRGSRHQ